MLKRILVVLDDSEASKAAKTYAMHLAKNCNASLTGMAVVDTPWITAAQPEPLGGSAYKIHRDQELVRRTRAHMEKMLESFVERCNQEEIKCSTSEREGFPVTEIEKISQEHDLIVIGRTTDFHFELDRENDLTVKHITRDSPRPLIIVGPLPSQGETVLIAYDGSLQAARTLHMYLLLGLADDHKVHIISIARHPQEAKDIAGRAQTMCELYGIKPTVKAITSTRPAEEIITTTAKEVQANLIVMGAFGHQGIREFFFGSCAQHMIKKSDIPLFIYH
jgi:nucleotide-binding universal stress UspA family protein